MSLFRRSEQRAVKPLQQNTFGSVVNYSAELVSETNALGIAAVFAAVGLLADAVASLPLEVYEDKGGVPTPTRLPHWLIRPSEAVTSYELLHGMVHSMALHGNYYAAIQRDNGFNTIGLTPVHPRNVTVYAPDGLRRQYLVMGDNVDGIDMLHMRWWTPPQWLKGVSPLEEHKNTFGLSIALERHLNQFYGEGGLPSSVLETEANLTPEQAQVLRDSWSTTHNRHRRPAVLTQGLKWKPITVSAADMEMQASREYQINEIARVYRIPPHMIGGKGDSQTYANVESQNLSFLQHTLRPWLVRVERTISDLLPAGQWARFNVDELLRADQLTRYRTHQLGIMSGILTPNEARAIENRTPYPGGDAFVMALPGAPMAEPDPANLDAPPVGTDTNPND
jgi:HK97 family phage portal protein